MIVCMFTYSYLRGNTLRIFTSYAALPPVYKNAVKVLKYAVDKCIYVSQITGCLQELDVRLLMVYIITVE